MTDEEHKAEGVGFRRGIEAAKAKCSTIDAKWSAGVTALTIRDRISALLDNHPKEK